MNSFLAYSYSTGLTENEQTEINEKVKKSREEFSKGFVKGASLSFVAYSLYSMTASAARAIDPNVPAPLPKNLPDNGAAVCPTPAPRPGFKPLSDGVKGTFIGGASAVCGAALQSGDFALGLGCAFLLVVGGIVINRR